MIDGAAQHELIVAAVHDGGGLAVVRGWDGPVDRDIRLHKVLVTEAATDRACLLRLRDQAGAGELTLRVADVLSADRAADAHRRLAEGGVGQPSRPGLHRLLRLRQLVGLRMRTHDQRHGRAFLIGRPEATPTVLRLDRLVCSGR